MMELLLFVAGAPLTVFLVYATIKHTDLVAITLLLAAPIALSSFSLGSLTADNLGSLAGLCIGLLALLKRGTIMLDWRVLLLAALPAAIAVAIGISNTANDLPAVPPMLRYVSIALLIVLVARQRPEQRTFTLGIARALVAVGALSVILGQFIDIFPRYTDPDSGGFRTGGLFGHPNFAAYVMSALLLALLLRRTWTLRVVSEIALLAVAILLTGALASTLTLAALWLLATLINRRIRDITLALAAGAIVLIFGALLVARVSTGLSTGQFDSFTWRVIQWNRLLSISASSREFGIGWQQSSVQSGNGLAAHSAYVQAYVELGWVGCLIVVAGAVIFIVALRKSLQNLLLVVYALVTSVTDPVIFYPSTLSVLVILLASNESPPISFRDNQGTPRYAEGRTLTYA